MVAHSPGGGWGGVFGGPHHHPLPRARSFGEGASRDERDYEPDAGGEEVEALQRAAVEAAAAAREAQHEGELLRQQCHVLKEALREAQREAERVAILGSPLPAQHTQGGARPPSPAGAAPAGSAAAAAPGGGSGGAGTNLTYLKNSVVAYLASRSPEERRAMLPALTLLLRLSPAEVARIEAAAGGASAGGGAAGGLLSFVSSPLAALSVGGKTGGWM